jgi:hypothetical protein
MTGKPGPLAANRGNHHDPCFHTQRRGGQVGRQRERGLPRAPSPG